MYPENYRYTKEHEWVCPSEEGTVLVGITHHAQDQLGDIVYVDLPEVGSSFDQHAEVASLESVKAVAEVFMPVSGEVIEVNEMLEEHPEQVNQNPHESGWLLKVRLADPGELDAMMDAASYAKFAAEESK
jgi:glycine cleavage system H protein